MSEQELIYVSIIMQLVVDGKADLDGLSPGVKKFLEGVLEDYHRNPEDEYTHQLYHFATVTFNPEREKMH